MQHLPLLVLVALLLSLALVAVERVTAATEEHRLELPETIKVNKVEYELGDESEAKDQRTGVKCYWKKGTKDELYRRDYHYFTPQERIGDIFSFHITEAQVKGGAKPPAHRYEYTISLKTLTPKQGPTWDSESAEFAKQLRKKHTFNAKKSKRLRTASPPHTAASASAVAVVVVVVLAVAADKVEHLCPLTRKGGPKAAFS